MNVKKKNLKTKNLFFILFAVSLIILAGLSGVLAQGNELSILNKDMLQIKSGEHTVFLYYNEACGGCTHYINNDLLRILSENGIKHVEKKDYVNNKENRAELNALTDKLGIPIIMNGHFSTFIDNKIVLQGHVPEHIIVDILKPENQSFFDKIVILQDEMTDMGTTAETYQVWAFKGEIKEYPIDTPITEYLNWFNENKESLITPPELMRKRLDVSILLPIVLVTGLVDGINPCAFAVLLFFIAFLFTLKRKRSHIIAVGGVYIFMIFLTYILIGVGLLQAIAISGVPHIMAKIGAWLVIALGLINLKDFFWYGKGFTLRVPMASKETLDKYIKKGTIPSAAVLGVLVGLCTFPCSGGIYVAILGLLASTTMMASFEGAFYLIAYNVMFVLPLIVILIFASNDKVIEKMQEMENKDKKYMKLLMGIVMIFLGLFILYGWI